MSSLLHLGHVQELRVRLAYSRVLEGPAHDLFLLDVHPRPADAFDEAAPARLLELLEPVLRMHGTEPDPYVVRVCRRHRSWEGDAAEADLSVSLCTGLSTTLAPAAAEVVRTALRQISASLDTERSSALSHAEALTEARLRVERGYPDAHADRLTVTDEEHVAADGRWSVGLALPASARFQVVIGFVDGDPRSTHIRRLPSSEVVDSVGTGTDG
jgi:hypothetical protein